MTTVQEWAVVEYTPSLEKRFEYVNEAHSRASVTIVTDMFETDGYYIPLIYKYPENSAKFEMVSCSLRNDGNVSYVMRIVDTEQLVLFASGDFRTENEKETIIVDGSEVLSGGGMQSDSEWNQLVTGLDKVAAAIDTSFSISESSGRYIVSWRDIDENSWDAADLSKLDKETLANINSMISGVQLKVTNASSSYWNSYELTEYIELSSIALRTDNGYSCTFNSYDDFFGKFDAVHGIHDVYVVTLVYTLMNGKQLHDKDIKRFCLDDNILPDSTWTVSCSPNLSGTIQTRELTVTASYNDDSRTSSSIARVYPQFTSIFGDSIISKTIQGVDIQPNTITWKVPVKEIASADRVTGLIELRDVSDKIRPVDGSSLVLLPLGEAAVSYPSVDIVMEAPVLQVKREQLELTIRVNGDEGIIGDIDGFVLKCNDGYAETDEKELTSFVATEPEYSRDADGNITSARYSVKLPGGEIPDSTEDLFTGEPISNYRVEAIIGQWRRGSNSQQLMFTYSRPEYDPMEYSVYDIVTSSGMQTMTSVKWNVNNIIEDGNGISSYSVTIKD